MRETECVRVPVDTGLIVMAPDVQHPKVPALRTSSDTTYLSMSFKKSAPPQNRQLNIVISNRHQEVDDFAEELTL